jgi:SAM-dependent methyltransferase
MSTPNDLHGLYNRAFHSAIEGESLRSARVMVPLLMQLFAPSSVLDVGCSNGIWLSTFRNHGVRRIFGIDGGGVDANALLIPQNEFLTMDLRNPAPLRERFDLALCLEVAEHLPAHSAPGFIDFLTKAAPIVVFGAAIPGQGGTNHINEHWPDYWRKLFSGRGFCLLDAIRPRIIYDHTVSWWYRQNTVVYCAEDALSLNPTLAKQVCPNGSELDWVYVDVLRRFIARYDVERRSPRILLKLLAASLRERLATAAFPRTHSARLS